MDVTVDVTMGEIRGAVRAAGAAGRPVCVHASLRSFGHVRGGAPTVVEGLLAEGCTVLVPTFSYRFAVAPPAHRRPARNGCDYAHLASRPNSGHVFATSSSDIDRAEMGAIPAAVLDAPASVRGNHPLNSFGAIGPRADDLIAGQAPLDVYAPLRALAAADGLVILMGVGLDRMTLLHLAEQRAGRRLFRRWANGPTGAPIEVEDGGCSAGFVQLEPILAPLATAVPVGRSLWRAYPASAALRAAAGAIRDDPPITRCGSPTCKRCEDAILGGPVI